MRMLMKARMNTELANQAIKNGTLEKTLLSALEGLKPEAAYFVTEDGDRCAVVVFDMQESSQLPSVCEPFFLELGAKIDVVPAMNVDDMQKGVTDVMSRR
ncbi:hypothetical protein [Streptomyces sp. NPDC048639]|uniref:hypothetical protein n=1 Tax=Streptomyces sp. NPDC048639 TaxID=3365581 RepID=UPI00371B0C85